MEIKVFYPKQKPIEGFFLEVTLPTLDGQITILDEHTPIIGILCEGNIVLKTNNHQIDLPVSKGIFEFFKNKLIIFVNYLRLSELEINEIINSLKNNFININNDYTGEINENNFLDRKSSSKF